MDDAWIGGAQAGLKGGHQRAGRNALQVVVAVERRSDTSLGRVRMGVIANDDAKTLREFVRASIAPGSTVYSDAHRGYPAALAGHTHLPLSQRAMKRQTGRHTSATPGVDRVISNLKAWLKATHHGVGADHLDAYLDEFVFRFNRRHNRSAGFASLLGLTTEVGHVAAATISPFSETAKRRGRSTGQTGLIHRNPPPPPPGAAPRRRRGAASNGTWRRTALDSGQGGGHDRGKSGKKGDP